MDESLLGSNNGGEICHKAESDHIRHDEGSDSILVPWLEDTELPRKQLDIPISI